MIFGVTNLGDQSDNSANLADSKENTSFQNLLLLGAFVIVAIWLLEYQAGLVQLFDSIGYSVTLIVVTLCYSLSRFRNNSKLAKTIVFFHIAIYLFALVVFSFIHVVNQGSLYPISSTMQWMPIIYIVAFLFLPTNLAMISSLVIYALLVCLLILSYTPIFPAGNVELNALMFNMVLAHGLYIVSMFSVIRLRNTTQRQQIRAQELEKEANLDGLLGIANRRYLQKLMDRFESERQAVSLILIDVDHFKQINDSYGHTAGDQVLLELIQCIIESLRPIDVIGRWGGEEFLVLADCAKGEDAVTLAQRIQQQVATHSFSLGKSITVSIGIADYEPGKQMEMTFNQADKALYQAKDNGRNQTVHFSQLSATEFISQ